MVYANQLRLGNYLFNTCREFETIAKVSSLDDHQIGCGIEGVRVSLCYKFENYKPIPLTTRMLASLPQTRVLEIHNSNGYFYNAPNGQSVRLNYLHQLQNLYFIITGEELSIDQKIIASANESIAENA